MSEELCQECGVRPGAYQRVDTDTETVHVKCFHGPVATFATAKADPVEARIAARGEARRNRYTGWAKARAEGLVS